MYQVGNKVCVLFVAWLDFGKDGAMAACISLYELPGTFATARIAVCSTSVSNLGCEQLFSCMARAIIHFFATLRSLNRLSSSIGRMGETLYVCFPIETTGAIPQNRSEHFGNIVVSDRFQNSCLVFV